MHHNLASKHNLPNKQKLPHQAERLALAVQLLAGTDNVSQGHAWRGHTEKILHGSYHPLIICISLACRQPLCCSSKESLRAT